jgi:OmpA-OmpF porin, OOP family
MASKKYKLLLGLITLMASTTFAQMGSSYNVFDSSVISSKKMPQQNEFWNNTYNFPAKPRNMWEVGVSVGALTISSDVAAKVPTLGFEAHIRKAFGYLFSLRLQYVNGVAKGLNWLPSSNYAKNSAWVESTYGGNLAPGSGYNPIYRDNTGLLRPQSPTLNGGNAQVVYYNYKTKVQDLSLEGIITLNNIRFHKQKTGFVIYGGAGIGFTAFNVKVNSLDANNRPYTSLFNTVWATQQSGGGIQNSKRKDILKLLKAGMDNTYETAGETEGKRRPKLGENTLKPSGTVLLGVSYKLGKRINIALEDRQTFAKSDLMDGQQWQEHAQGDAVLTRDFDSWNFLSLGLNFNLGGKSVEPLWWLNPLDYAYSELNNPKHMKLPKPVFDDADGDGVTDQLDREPNTPAGCPVDTHGVTKDTDGDGVPDCKDKQLITPTECQPVDADGVGKCPEPACCKDNRAALDELKKGGGISGGGDCAADYPSLTIKSVSLSADNKAMLATVAAKLKEKPDCKIALTAYPKADKRSQSLADKKLEAVRNYLVEKLGISADRISTDKVIDGGDANTVDIKSN